MIRTLPPNAFRSSRCEKTKSTTPLLFDFPAEYMRNEIEAGYGRHARSHHWPTVASIDRSVGAVVVASIGTGRTLELGRFDMPADEEQRASMHGVDLICRAISFSDSPSPATCPIMADLGASIHGLFGCAWGARGSWRRSVDDHALASFGSWGLGLDFGVSCLRPPRSAACIAVHPWKGLALETTVKIPMFASFLYCLLMWAH